MNEQPRDQEHAGHEETVVEQHDQIEAEPAHLVAIAEIGVVDDGMMDQHQQRDEGARAVERDDAPRRRGGLIVFVGLAQHRFGSKAEPLFDHFSNAS